MEAHRSMNNEHFDILDKKIDKLDSHLEKITERLGSIDETQIKQEEALKYHIKRTDLLENIVQKNEEEVEKKLASVEKKLEPITKHIDYVQGGLKLLAGLGLILGILASIQKLFF
jgi:prefoldin subunit 5